MDGLAGKSPHELTARVFAGDQDETFAVDLDFHFAVDERTYYFHGGRVLPFALIARRKSIMALSYRPRING